MPEFQFEGIGDFFAMGGYGLYVWVSYGFFLVVMGFNLWLPLRQRANTMRLSQARQLRKQQPDGSGGRLAAEAQQAVQQQQALPRQGIDERNLS